MNRRDYLLGLLGTVGIGAGVYRLATSGEGVAAIDPQTVSVVGEQGTESARIPARDGLTVVDFFSTFCAGCDEQIAALEPVQRESQDLSVISVTAQTVGDGFTLDDLRDWWAQHGGPWPVAVDDGSLAAAADVKRIPTVVVIDAEGRIHWAKSDASTAAIRDGVATARDAFRERE
jgi:thiol-disulfide isomerase/thioredoxin